MDVWKLEFLNGLCGMLCEEAKDGGEGGRVADVASHKFIRIGGIDIICRLFHLIHLFCRYFVIV